MNSFVVAHLQKFKVADLIPMEKHLDHSAENSSNKDIDKSLTHLNYDICNMHSTCCNLREKVTEKIANRSNNGTKLRRDAVAFCSVVISASAEFFKDKTPEQIQNYFEAAKDGLDKIFGTQNCVTCMVHMDERGRSDGTVSPHMHYVFVPLTQNNELCAKKIITKTALTELQDKLPKFLQEQGFNICRGVKNSPLRHITTREWKRSELLKEELQDNLLHALRSDNYAMVRAAADQAVGLIENNSELVRKRRELDKLAEEMQQQKRYIVAKMREQQARSDELVRLAQKLDGREQMLQMYKASLEAQDKNVALQKLADDLEHQEQQLRLKQKQFDKDIIERVYVLAKQAVANEVEREGEQGRFAIAAMKVLKERDPARWKEVLNAAGKTLAVTRRVVKEINQEKLLPK